jgi:DNA-binding GntR family transcriptional regulator
MLSQRINRSGINLSTLSESAYQRLRTMILDGTLPAGGRLLENSLAETLSISRTPVREAIARLAADGLVTRDSDGRAVIRQLSAGEVMEILHIRRLIEVEAAGLAAEQGSVTDELSEIRETLVRFREGCHPASSEHMTIDDRLHVEIARMASNRVLTGIIVDLKLRTRMFDMAVVPDRFEPGCIEHIAIIDAISAHDRERAREAMQLHIDNVRNSIIERLRRFC